MGDLLDVTLSAPAVDDILIYNGLQWVNTPSGGLGGGAGAGISPGTIVPYGGAGAIPPGFLECNGQTELQASYPDLYAVMGTTFNTGGEAGNEFRLPDFRGRVAVGADPGNATLSRSHDIGDYGGEEEHQLTIGELPSHDHPGSAASPDGNHVHGNVPATYNGNQGSGGTNAARDAGGTTSLAGLHSHTVTVSPQGSDQDHETMQPYVGTRWIVAADVSSGGQPINIVPLVGKTFAPVGNAPLIKTDVFNFVAPGSTTDTVDLTAGATVAVPPSATHALIRTNLNVVATAGNIILVQAAKDAIDTKEIKQTRDPSAPEHNDFATWVVEFDGGTFTFEYEIQDVFGSGGAGDNGVLQFYLEGFYIDETANIQNSIGGVPAGTILSWGGNIGTPSGFLDCDGSVVSRATFPELFSTIGTTYNVGGESSLEFRLPNLSGRFVVGDGDSGTTGSTNLNLGDTGGEARHILSVGELATHSHSASGTALLDGAHTHGGVAIAINAADQAGSGMSECQPGATASGGAHTHTLSITVGNQGSSNSHENMPPYLTVKYVIAAVTGAGAQSSGGFYVGDVKPTIRQVSDPGWVIMDDGSIGSAASGATTRANADTEALYTLLWALDPSDTFVPVNGGHGASAAADFAANKWIALPKALGRVLAGADPGNAVLSRPADTGRYTGSENHTLTVGQLPSHTHPIGSHTHPIGGTVPCGTGNAAGPNVGACAGGWSTTANTSGPSSGNTGSQGSDQAHETMQPSLFVNYMIKL